MAEHPVGSAPAALHRMMLSSTFRIFPGRLSRGDFLGAIISPNTRIFQSGGVSHSRSNTRTWKNSRMNPRIRSVAGHASTGFHRGQSSGEDSFSLSRRMRKGEPRWRMRLANIPEARSGFQDSPCAPSVSKQDRRSGTHVRGWSVLTPSQAVHTEDAEDHGAPRRSVTSDCRCLPTQAG